MSISWWASFGSAAVFLYWVFLDWADRRRARREPVLPVAGCVCEERVSVVIPARNEALNLPNCLDALAAQSHPPLEIVVVDDNSTDGTAELVAQYCRRHPNVRLIRGAALEEGRTGKCFALHQGVTSARGDWILFVDADTWLHPDCLVSALAHFRQHNLDMLSLTARQQAESWAEQAVQPVVYALLNRQYPLGGDGAAANGQFILVKRSAYEAVGGHRQVASELVEDVALARLFHQHGRRTGFINGTAFFSTRMYRGLTDLWHGWSKNSFRLFSPRKIDTTLQLAVRSMPWLALAASLATGRWGDATIWGTAVAAGLAFDWRIRRRQAFDPTTVWLQPVGALLVAAILVNSWLRQALGLKAVWKGRTYHSGGKR